MKDCNYISQYQSQEEVFTGALSVLLSSRGVAFPRYKVGTYLLISFQESPALDPAFEANLVLIKCLHKTAKTCWADVTQL